jgi:hypothetical protein
LPCSSSAKKDAYDEGGDITVTYLMDAAENKFKTRVLLKTWSAPTKEQEQILALTAQVHQLRIAKAAPKKEKRAPKDSSKGKQDKDTKWAWKKVLPKEGEPVTKVVDGKNYHLACEHHPNQWVCHTTAECSKNPANNGVPKDVQAKQCFKKARLAAAALLAEDDHCTMRWDLGAPPMHHPTYAVCVYTHTGLFVSLV